MNGLAIHALVAADGHHDIDPARSIHWMLPADAELIYGTISSLIVFAVLIKFGGPLLGKALRARTERIQGDLDSAATAKTAADADAAQIRQAAGDIDAEQRRLFAEADIRAEALLTDGRAMLDAEVEALQIQAAADVRAAGTRVSDELRAEVVRLANAATDASLADGIIDAATHQQLIEGFIAKVGAS